MEVFTLKEYVWPIPRVWHETEPWQWGDAPVHSLAAALFLEPRQIHYFEDLGYVHDGMQHCPKNARGGQLPNSKALGHGPWDAEEKGGIGCRCECNPTAVTLNSQCQQILEMSVR